MHLSVLMGTRIGYVKVLRGLPKIGSKIDESDKKNGIWEVFFNNLHVNTLV